MIILLGEEEEIHESKRVQSLWFGLLYIIIQNEVGGLAWCTMV
jgi:hypothetical protein